MVLCSVLPSMLCLMIIHGCGLWSYAVFCCVCSVLSMVVVLCSVCSALRLLWSMVFCSVCSALWLLWSMVFCSVCSLSLCHMQTLFDFGILWQDLAPHKCVPSSVHFLDVCQSFCTCPPAQYAMLFVSAISLCDLMAPCPSKSERKLLSASTTHLWVFTVYLVIPGSKEQKQDKTKIHSPPFDTFR